MSLLSSPSLSVYKAGMPEEISAVMSLSTGTAATDNIRTETWNGREYTVVPVVALVEGVLHGANAKAPEFASAEEFGKFPKAWDGRPVVMNHPQINGVFVSAGIPQVLEDFGLGMIFNSRMEDKKLKCEAWLDHGRIEELGGESLSTLERIREGKVVEVSVGAWIDSQTSSGTYKGKKYAAKWHNVAPDHLAFLSEGVPGACSVKDGCGVPRLFHGAAAHIGAASGDCCSDCAAGKPCTGCEAGGLELTNEQKAVQAFLAELEAGLEFDDGLSVQKVPADMDMRDVRTIVFQGLLELLDLKAYDIDVLALTQNAVVYYIWGMSGLRMRNYSVNDDGVIKFAGEEVPVNLLTRIVPRQTTAPMVNHQQENEMSGTSSGTGSAAAPSTNGEGAGTAAPAPAPTPSPTPTPTPTSALTSAAAAAATPTFEELLRAAPAAMRESFESGVKMHEQRKTELVASLTANAANAFTSEELQAFSLDRLEKLNKLATAGSGEGRAVPLGQPGINANVAGGGNGAPAAFSAAPSNFLGQTAGETAQ